MQKNKAVKLFALTFFAILSIAFMAPAAQAGIPRGGGDLFMKYIGKIVTRVDSGPWSPWVWTSQVKLCPNGLWSFDYTRYRTVTKTYWLAERWFSWAWLDGNIVYYERWRNFQGPFTYSITQKQMKEVYWFDPVTYDPRYPWAQEEFFYRDSYLWADWTGLDGVRDPDTGVPLQSHRVFFDEIPYYQDGPHQPDQTDAMVIDLAQYSAGQHMIRIEGTWMNGTITPEFLMIPIRTGDYLEMSINTPPGMPIEPGKRNLLPGALMVRNNLDEDRAMYFMLGDSSVSPNDWRVDSFFDITYKIDIPDNGTVVPAGATSFFDIYVDVPPHTPPGLIIETEIIALDLVGLGGLIPDSPEPIAAHVATAKLDTAVVPATQQLTVNKPVAIAGADHIILEGTGFPADSQAGITSSFFDVFFDTVSTNSTGGFKYDLPLSINFTDYGQQTFAAIDLMTGTSATANVKMNGPDINLDGNIDIFDLVTIAVHFGDKIYVWYPPHMAAATSAVIIPALALWIFFEKRRKR